MSSNRAPAAGRPVQAIVKGMQRVGVHPSTTRLIEDPLSQFRGGLIDVRSVARHHMGNDVITILALRHWKGVGF